MKTIGIIGGMGPLATADLYKKITVNTAADKDQDQIHIVIDSNTAIPDRTKINAYIPMHTCHSVISIRLFHQYNASWNHAILCIVLAT